MQLTVISSNPTKNGNYCNKLQAKTVVNVATAFGTVSEERQQTFYMFTVEQNAPGKSAELDLSRFEVISKEHIIPEGESAGEVIQLKYLKPLAQ